MVAWGHLFHYARSLKTKGKRWEVNQCVLRSVQMQQPLWIWSREFNTCFRLSSPSRYPPMHLIQSVNIPLGPPQPYPQNKPTTVTHPLYQVPANVKNTHRRTKGISLNRWAKHAMLQDDRLVRFPLHRTPALIVRTANLRVQTFPVEMQILLAQPAPIRIKNSSFIVRIWVWIPHPATEPAAL